jgi:hypothetical protein
MLTDLLGIWFVPVLAVLGLVPTLIVVFHPRMPRMKNASPIEELREFKNRAPIAGQITWVFYWSLLGFFVLLVVERFLRWAL